MSGKLVTLVLDLPTKMDPSRRLVLACLADHANERDGAVAWPSNKLIASRTGICERQVREHRVGLETSGLIELVSNARGGRGKAKVYRLKADTMLMELAAVDPKKAAMHYRVLRQIPGILPLGFSLQNPAVSVLNPAVSTTKPGGPPPKTRRPTATEPKEPEYEPEKFEPARAREGHRPDIAASSQNPFIKIPTDPTPRPRGMTREEQLAYVQKQLAGEAERAAAASATVAARPNGEQQHPNEYARSRQKRQTYDARIARKAARRKAPTNTGE
jgi:hypothetical protein